MTTLPPGTFRRGEQLAAIAYAEEHGTARIVRENGTVVAMISIPKPEARSVVEAERDELHACLQAAHYAAHEQGDQPWSDRVDARIAAALTRAASESDSASVDLARLRADALTIASMEGERDALISRCREAVAALDGMISAAQHPIQCVELGGGVCGCGLGVARQTALTTRGRIAATITSNPTDPVTEAERAFVAAHRAYKGVNPLNFEERSTFVAAMAEARSAYIAAMAALDAADAAAKGHGPVSDARRFLPGMNADDHAPNCAIRNSRDGWDADCTCGGHDAASATKVRGG
jgi:hypothetical protein